MSKFCSNCGAALDPAAKFCSQCGSVASGTTAVSGGATLATPDQPAKKSNRRVWKVVAIVLGCIVLVFVLAVGMVFFYGYRTYRRVKASIEAAEVPAPGALPLPVPLPGVLPASNDPGSPAPPVQTPAPSDLGPLKPANPKAGQCAVIPREEMNQLLQANFTEATQDATGCTYQGPGRGQWARLEVRWTGGKKVLADMKSNYNDLLRDIAPANMPFRPVSGIGDEAYVNATNIYTVRKGDAAISFDMSYFAYSDELCKAAIKRVLARL